MRDPAFSLPRGSGHVEYASREKTACGGRAKEWRGGSPQVKARLNRATGCPFPPFEQIDAAP